MATLDAALTLDEAQAYLGEVMDTLPPAIFDDLNGGVVLQPGIVLSAEGPGLYTLGAYHVDPRGLGRTVVIHYGSFLQVYGRRPRAAQKRALRDVLVHELTHHIESKAGVRDLERLDELQLENWRRRRHKKP